MAKFMTSLNLFFSNVVARIKTSSLGYRLAKGAFWSITGSIISRCAALLISVIVARIIGKEQFGELGIIQSSIGMFSVFAGFGLGVMSTKFVAEFREQDPDKSGRIIALSMLISSCSGVLISICVYLFASLLADKSLGAPHLTYALKISSILLFLGAVNGSQTGALSGFESFKTIAKVNIISSVASLPISIIGAYYGSLEGVIWAMIATMVISYLINKHELQKQLKTNSIKLHYKSCLNERSLILSFSVPSLMGSMLVGPVNWITGAILVNQINGYSEMGIFNAANQWRYAILYVPMTIGSIALPIMSNVAKEYGKEKLLKIFKYNIMISTIIAVVTAMLVSMFSKIIMSSYGNEFASGWIVLVALSVSAILMSLNNVIGQTITSMGNMWHGFTFNAMWSIVLILLTLILVPTFGALGLAIAINGAYALHTIWQSLYAVRLISANNN